MRAWYSVDAAGTASDLSEIAGRELLKQWGLNASDTRLLATHRRMQTTSLTLTGTYLCIRYGTVAIAATNSCSLLSDSGHESSGVVHEVCGRLRSYRNFRHPAWSWYAMSMDPVASAQESCCRSASTPRRELIEVDNRFSRVLQDPS